MATTNPSPAGKLSGRKVNVFVNKEVKPEVVQEALRRIYDLSGCTACGFLGFDVIFHGLSDPAGGGVDTHGLNGISGIAIGS
jgi:hypothetical protein